MLPTYVLRDALTLDQLWHSHGALSYFRRRLIASAASTSGQQQQQQQQQTLNPNSGSQIFFKLEALAIPGNV